MAQPLTSSPPPSGAVVVDATESNGPCHSSVVMSSKPGCPASVAGQHASAHAATPMDTTIFTDASPDGCLNESTIADHSGTAEATVWGIQAVRARAALRVTTP